MGDHKPLAAATTAVDDMGEDDVVIADHQPRVGSKHHPLAGHPQVQEEEEDGLGDIELAMLPRKDSLEPSVSPLNFLYLSHRPGCL